MNLPLTDSEVNNALNLRGFEEHPVITLLNNYQIKIIDIAKNLKEKNNSEAQDYICANLGDFADEVERINDFNFESLEIIAIWSKLDKINLNSRYINYNIAKILSSSYGIVTLGSEWKGTPRSLLQKGDYPVGALKSEKQVQLYTQRLSRIDRFLEEIDFYRTGSKLSFEELSQRIKNNDPLIEDEINKISAREKLPQMKVLGYIHENFGNGYIPLYVILNRQLAEIKLTK